MQVSRTNDPNEGTRQTRRAKAKTCCFLCRPWAAYKWFDTRVSWDVYNEPSVLTRQAENRRSLISTSIDVHVHIDRDVHPRVNRLRATRILRYTYRSLVTSYKSHVQTYTLHVTSYTYKRIRRRGRGANIREKPTSYMKYKHIKNAVIT